jgi:hypothetical protein
MADENLLHKAATKSPQLGIESLILQVRNKQKFAFT